MESATSCVSTEKAVTSARVRMGTSLKIITGYAKPEVAILCCRLLNLNVCKPTERRSGAIREVRC